ncbi:MAG: tripartite tricarboxylate transporter substrate binding protein [Alicycliphilus sp.]|jgi:tripartite-type tricarboxylate transporter receptor subunit TctC|nr:tripartite tricarboxylate transporter substrate binding protein [Pseudomonadota bacterium]TXJ11293.1 MAG: tripartite tricarboxylate transporter substrate binding protein [Alicycliphilus sp.]HRO54283.1 tripartite tricarboxylate transporter substrate binding protein [Alicycliphilus sp.]
MFKKALVAALAVVASAAALADAYPSRPITLIVGFPPGGGADAVARIVSEKLGRVLSQSVIVDNRPGAGTTIASDLVARAPSDGYTLLLGSANLYGSDQLLYKSARYDGVKSFTPIARWSNSPMLLAVKKDFPESSVKGLIERARKNPGKLTYSSSGTGVVTHLAGASFAHAAGIDMLHVPFKGGAPSIQAVGAGDVDMTFGTPPSVLPMVQGGKLRLVAVTTADRSPLFPELPSMKESGINDFDFSLWFGLYGPANLPPEVTKKLFEASNQVLNDPDVRSRLEKQGNVAWPSASAEEFKAWAINDGKKYKTITERSGAAEGGK